MKAIGLLAPASIILTFSACNPRDPQTPPVPTVPKQKPPTLLIQAPPTQALHNEIVRLQPSTGHHINLEAPNACGGGTLQEKTARGITCQLSASGEQTLTVSICDDAKTFCKVEKHTVTVAGEPARSGAAPSKMSAPAPGAHRGSKGFIQNDPAAALARAKTENKLLLIDFYGVWCPPCNLLDELVFDTPEFQTASGDFVRVQLDADSETSWNWKDRFRIGGYPTIVIADGNLEEIGRVVGYRPLKVLLSWVAEQKKLRDSPVSKTSDRKRRGNWHLDRNEFAEAVAEFKGLPDLSRDSESRRRLQLAELELLKQNGADRVKLTEAYERLAREFPNEVEYATWILELFDLDLARAKLLLPRAVESLARWRRSPKLAEKDFSAGDLFWIEAELWEKSGDDARAKKAYTAAAGAYASLSQGSPLPLARGANLEVANALHKGGEHEKARKLFEQLAAAYPNEFTFHYNYASALLELKEYGPALERAEKALQFSYGDNWIRSVGLKARIQLASGDKAGARRTLESALSEVVLPSSPHVRTHVMVGRLRALLDKT